VDIFKSDHRLPIIWAAASMPLKNIIIKLIYINIPRMIDVPYLSFKKVNYTKFTRTKEKEGCQRNMSKIHIFQHESNA